ncbi:MULTISPECIES: hypothetical protein [Trichocoleus]|uniref:Uncharacterized protein n=1 Tax=Trichocoleus desertorum GB2-A4 TaxID=2933944 RepID=A0ABV0J6J5_9CYAN|nr:hypothetical protein [Trichocoleus sp. FACHB-46]MBD1863518.1 hypothetical protein [Trichocoleus sp. FACHB-46]
MSISTAFKFTTLGCFILLSAAKVVPVLAESANFRTLNLSPGFSRAAGTARGFTGGSYSLPSIANSDREGKRCLGFGDTQPDHIMVLQKDFSRLQLQVDTQGKDTTLVVKGPNNTVLCGDDTGSNKDASVSQPKWSAGTYEIWVGTFDAGARWKYTLTAQQ